MPCSHIEFKLLKRLGEQGLVEERKSSVVQSCLKQVLINQSVELVCTKHDRHYNNNPQNRIQKYVNFYPRIQNQPYYELWRNKEDKEDGRSKSEDIDGRFLGLGERFEDIALSTLSENRSLGRVLEVFVKIRVHSSVLGEFGVSLFTIFVRFLEAAL